ncbi:hypothetical protein ADUPG1_013957 [Aduncisulcus paluster]|uniref:Uncharacterized protein n=1 Tax=Aduncisulcus paluster TaxID=2918883 RepID=A0ABQ5K5H5_9EUKA|nr:hypothetical protein ADUPG1_013957 [Aduncisulcus paluster]
MGFVIKNPHSAMPFRSTKKIAPSISKQEYPRKEVIVIPEIVHSGNEDCVPIPRDDPNVGNPDFPNIKARNHNIKFNLPGHIKDEEALKMMRGQAISAIFTDISIPFPSSIHMKGVYICMDRSVPLTSYIIFTFISSRKRKVSKTCKFVGQNWYFLPIDLPDVVICEISRLKKRGDESFKMSSLVFLKKDTQKQAIARKSREDTLEKLWTETPSIMTEPQELDCYAFPFPRDDPIIIKPSLELIRAKNNSKCRQCIDYDMSLNARIMIGRKLIRLYDDEPFSLSHLLIPFPAPSHMSGAYILVDGRFCSPTLLFTFIHSDGRKTCKKYQFSRPMHSSEWHFLPIHLSKVVSCKIEGKGTWEQKNSRCFRIYELLFTLSKELARKEHEKTAIEQLCLLPWEKAQEK